MVEAVQEMSLREVGIRGPGSYERGVNHRARDRARDDNRQLGNSDDQRPRPSTAVDRTSRARQIEHQSSLRSLLSSSEVGSSETQEEILRRIMDDGMLDGIDLNNIDISQEDELGEKIAEAYRMRYGQHEGARTSHANRSTSSTSRERTSEHERRHRRQGRSPNPSNDTQHTPHPPVSRPHLLEAYPTSHGHRRRTSSETRRQTSPIPPSSRGSSRDTQRPAARSATDLSSESTIPSTRRPHPEDLSNSGRRRTDPQSLQPHGDPHSSGAEAPRSPNLRPRNRLATDTRRAPIVHNLISSPPNSDQISPNLAPRITGPSTEDDSQAVTSSVDPLQSFLEPSISCDRCGKRKIEYDLHWNCSQCHEGRYNLCLSCYRNGRGCLHWFGFGFAAINRYMRYEHPEGSRSSQPLPHRLIGHQYLHPPDESLQPQTSDSVLSSTSNPKSRLLSDAFCSNCSNHSPEKYWKCDSCNEGEWGFCNDCVNQGRSCKHALLPVNYLKPLTFHKTTESKSQLQFSSAANEFSPTIPSPNQKIDLAQRETYTPSPISTKCAICTYPIPPSTTRFHCFQCNAGDFDIDAACYSRLVQNGKITAENGPKGWRRCPKGHRMIIAGFQDSAIGQRRVVVEDLVGGHALKDDVKADGSLEWRWPEGHQNQTKTILKASTGRITTSTESPANDGTPLMLKKYPPNGGVGMRVIAIWSRWPQDDIRDELAFPKGAEIRECEEVNSDWFWGIYCTRTGLFPSNYVRVIEKVGYA